MKLLNQQASLKLLKKYKIPVCPNKLCTSLSESILFAKKNYPVVLKIDSEDIIHKSDVGAVIANIQNEVELKKAYSNITNIAKKLNAKINGMLVQKQVTGHNILIGMKRDLTFGPVIIFGLGGVLVEVLNDVSRRIAPVSLSEAKSMISEIKTYKILQGYRGEPGADLEGLANIIVSLSDLSLNEDISEIDFNPVMSSEKSYVVDARMLI